MARDSKDAPKPMGKTRGRPRGPKTEALVITLEPRLLEQIDRWRFENQMPSRMAAIRALIGKGLAK